MLSHSKVKDLEIYIDNLGIILIALGFNDCYVWCCPVVPTDYDAISRIITLDSCTPSAHFMIGITDDILCDADERFEIILMSLNDSCTVTSSSVPVYIIDNDGKLDCQVYT